MCEVAPVVWQGQLCLLECIRPVSGGTPSDYYLSLIEMQADRELARFAEGYSLASAQVHNGTLYVFAARYEPKSGWNDVTLFKSSDLKSWEKKIVVKQDPREHLFNSSVCEGPDGFVMAYETDDPSYAPFSIKFARSKDLESWTRGQTLFLGPTVTLLAPVFDTSLAITI
jgi:alpha-L-fucosidase